MPICWLLVTPPGLPRRWLARSRKPVQTSGPGLAPGPAQPETLGAGFFFFRRAKLYARIREWARKWQAHLCTAMVRATLSVKLQLTIGWPNEPSIRLTPVLMGSASPKRTLPREHLWGRGPRCTR